MRFGSFFVATVAVGGLIGWFAPGGTQSAAETPPATDVQASDRVEAAQARRWSADEVVLPRGENGHFYAEVSNGSGSVTMLVDTGASVVALTADDAAMMGVKWHSGQVRPVARGAGGEVYGVPVVLDRIAVGGIEARRVQAVVIPEDLDVSLLGQSFLSRIDRLELTAATMVLHD